MNSDFANINPPVNASACLLSSVIIQKPDTEQLDMVISALSGHNTHSNSAVSTIFAVSTEKNE